MRRVVLYIVTTAVLALTLGVQSGSAQHYIGIRGGMGSGNARFDPKEEMRAVWGLPSFGLSWKYYSPERVVGGIGMELLFMQRGYKILTQELIDPSNPEEGLHTTESYQRTINSIMLPLIWQPHVYMFDRRMRVFLNLALTFSYNFSSRQKITDELTGASESGKYEMMSTRDNPFGYGLFGGAGVGWLFGRWEIMGEFRYHFGLGDILRNPNKYKGNPQRSPLDGMQIQLGVYYRLGKGGILAPRHPRHRPPKNGKSPATLNSNAKAAD